MTHEARISALDDDGGDESAILTSETGANRPTPQWLIDCGATSHMEKLRTAFHEYAEVLQVPEHVVRADGSHVQVLAKVTYSYDSG